LPEIPRWYKDDFLCQKGREDVEYAEEVLIIAGKDHTDPGRIIAETQFRFLDEIILILIISKPFQITKPFS
jgi:hypothetical protein